MKAKDIMAKDIISLNPEDSCTHALEQLSNIKISGLPVIDKDKNLVGMFTEKEVLAKILPSYIEKVGSFSYEDNPKAVKNKVALLLDLKVKDIMRTQVVTVDEDTALCEVAHIMLTQKARRLPVLNKDKKVIGMLARGDVVKALLQKYQ